MSIVLLNLALAFIFGVYLAFYFVFYRLNLANPWRWPVSIVSSLIVGLLMAIIDFWIIWPPVNILAGVVGFALMMLIALSLIGYPKLWQSDKETEQSM